jgi:hypothetical protein
VKHIVVIIAVVAALPALAQTRQPTPTSTTTQAPSQPSSSARPLVVIDMTEDVIEAAPQRPAQLPLVVAPAAHKHRSLIRLRTDFRAQVLSSVSCL